MAAGTPVIAFANGALPQVIEQARTGYLVNDVAEMAAAMRKLDSIDPAVCYQSARRRFSRGNMIAGYFAAYGALAQLGKRHLRSAS